MTKEEFSGKFRYTLMGLALEGLARLTPPGDARVRMISNLPDTIDSIVSQMWHAAQSVDADLLHQPKREGANGHR